jgi:hypothetical protein
LDDVLLQEVRPPLITAIIISSRSPSFVSKPIMKIHALATLAFITANGVKAQVVENPCVICPNGATAGDDLAPWADVGILTTCKELIETAPLHETGTLSCANYGFYEPTCCPAPLQDPCILCPIGVTVADDIATSYYCSDIITGFSQFESDSDTCTFMGTYYEFMCCPTPPENPCNICPNGATAGDDFVPSSTDGEVVPYLIVGIGSPTCMYLITLAKQHETGSAACGNFEAYEISCCPDVTAYTTAIPVEETSTSATTISGQDSCEACPNGVTFEGEFEFEGVSMTCSDIISVVVGLESGSNECAEVPREEVELICCPSGVIPEIGGGTVATTAAPAVETSTSATATVITEIDGGTATTTAAPAVETNTSTNATASADSNDVASGGVSISGFGGFSLVSVVSALWAIGFV